MKVEKILNIIQAILFIETFVFLGLMLFRVFTPGIMVVVWFMPLAATANLGVAALRVVLREDS